MNSYNNVYSNNLGTDFFINLGITNSGIFVKGENLSKEKFKIAPSRGIIRTRGGPVKRSILKAGELIISGEINGIYLSLNFSRQDNNDMIIKGEARRGKDKIKVEFWSKDINYLSDDFVKIPANITQVIILLLQSEKGGEIESRGELNIESNSKTDVEEEDEQLFDKIKFTETSWKAYSENSLKWEEPISDIICGKESPISDLALQIKDITNENLPVLIQGEPGTGKELVAKAVHNLSYRKDEPLITIHTGTIPKELLASELFGHKKGAFTGATSNKRGKFEEAHKGTIFLDEISTMSPEVQISLLRVLEDKLIKPLSSSSNQEIKVDVRVIAASNEDLKQMVIKKLFRKDLYDRLNGFNLELLPLRKRRQDIPALVSYYSHLFGDKIRFAENLFKSMIWYSWPGNIRELKKIVEAAQLCAESKR